MPADQDRWAKWLLEGRDGGDPEQRAKALEHLMPIRDRVLENAAVRPGEVVLDVGGGDGLIAFGALARVGSTGEVILADVSPDLVAHASQLADDLGRLSACHSSSHVQKISTRSRTSR